MLSCEHDDAETDLSRRLVTAGPIRGRFLHLQGATRQGATRQCALGRGGVCGRFLDLQGVTREAALGRGGGEL